MRLLMHSDMKPAAIISENSVWSFEQQATESAWNRANAGGPVCVFVQQKAKKVKPDWADALQATSGGLTGSTSTACRLAISSASNSFFDNFPTGVLGRLARISISVGISYFASLSARKDFSSSIPNAACPGF